MSTEVREWGFDFLIIPGSRLSKKIIGVRLLCYRFPFIHAVVFS